MAEGTTYSPATINDVYFVKGETFSITTGMIFDILGGILSSGSSEITLSYHTTKSMKYVTPTVTSFEGSMRGINGYVNNWTTREFVNNPDTSYPYTINFYKRSDKTIIVIINLTNATSFPPNNTPVNFALGKIVISFS